VFFARKFEPIINQAIIKQLEEWIYGSSPKDTPSIDSYWQSLYHHQDKSPPNDDAILTAGHSLSRIAARSLCPLKIKSLLEMTTYLHEDTYMVKKFFGGSHSFTNSSFYFYRAR